MTGDNKDDSSVAADDNVISGIDNDDEKDSVLNML